MSSSDIQENIFTLDSNLKDINVRILKTTDYYNTGFASVHPAIWCQGTVYRTFMTSCEKEMLINAANKEHGVPMETYDAVQWLIENTDKIKFFYYRGLIY